MITSLGPEYEFGCTSFRQIISISRVQKSCRKFKSQVKVWWPIVIIVNSVIILTNIKIIWIKSDMILK